MMNIKEVQEMLEARKNAKNIATVGGTISTDMVTVVKKSNNVIVKVSDSQATTYMKLCRDKGELVNPLYRTWDGKQNGAMDKEIKRLVALKSIIRPSEPQIKLLKEICERLECEVPDYSQLIGGRDGSMSALLKEVSALEFEVNRNKPLSENQLEIILDMYYCTDIDMSDLKEAYGTQIIYDADGNQVKHSNGTVAWTRMDMADMFFDIQANVTYQEASDFISKNNAIVYKWKATRLKQGQIIRIQNLQKKNGMVPMSEHQLLQMTEAQAQKYIGNEEYILRDRELVKFSSEAMFDRLADDEKHPKNIEQALDADYTNRANIIHSIYGMMGMLAKEEDFIECDASEDVLRDACSVARELCGTQALIDLLSD